MKTTLRAVAGLALVLLLLVVPVRAGLRRLLPGAAPGVDAVDDGRPFDPRALPAALVRAALAAPAAPGPAALRAAAAGASPRALLALVDERVRVLPGAGASRAPGQVLLEGEATALDRARLLVALLEVAGRRARLVRGDGHTLVDPPPAEGPGVHPALRAAAEAEVAAHGPLLWATLEDEAAWRRTAPPPPGPEAAWWAQVEEDGRWEDLVPRGVVGAADPRVPAASELEALTWRVTLRVYEDHGGDRGVERLRWTAPAEDLHLAPLALAVVPDGSFACMAPVALVGARAVATGTPIDRRRAARIGFSVITQGPGAPARCASRILAVAAPEGATPLEQGLALCAAARLAVTTGPAADAELAAATGAELALAGEALLLRDWDAPRDPEARRSLRLHAALRAGRALAGRVGPAAGRVHAWQARPAVAVERLAVRVTADALERTRGFDLLDPGHGFAPVEADPDQAIAARAATDQALVDGRAEAWVLLDLADGPGARASVDLLAAALRAGDALRAPCLPGRPIDLQGRAAPRVRATRVREGRADEVVGVRLDAGPQAVPVLEDGTGGAGGVEVRVPRAPAGADLRAKIAAGLKGAAALLPSELLPSGALMGGVVGHLHRVSRAFDGAAGALEQLAMLFSGNLEELPSEEERAALRRELEEQLHALGPGLAADLAQGIAVDVLGAAAAGLPVLRDPAAGEASPTLELLSRVARSALELAALRAQRGGPAPAAAAAEGAAEREALRDVLVDAAQVTRGLREAGVTTEQVRALVAARDLADLAAWLRGDPRPPVEDLLAGEG